MAYSFTEPDDIKDEESDVEEEEAEEHQPSGPMMVPMADILNHVAKNNAHLNFGKDSLTMLAIKPIKKVCFYCYLM